MINSATTANTIPIRRHVRRAKGVPRVTDKIPKITASSPKKAARYSGMGIIFNVPRSFRAELEPSLQISDKPLTAAILADEILALGPQTVVCRAA
jgi:hypothetical protein